MEIQSPGHKTMCWALPRRDHAALGWEQNPKGFFGGGGGFGRTPQLDLVPPSHPIPLSPESRGMFSPPSWDFWESQNPAAPLIPPRAAARASSVSLLPDVCPHPRWGGTGPCPLRVTSTGCRASSPVLWDLQGFGPTWILSVPPCVTALAVPSAAWHCPCGQTLATVPQSLPWVALGVPSVTLGRCHPRRCHLRALGCRGVSQCPPRRWLCTPCCP